MEIFDSHAHYDDEAFDSDREELLNRLPSLGVCGVETGGASRAGSRASVELARRWPYVYAAVGLHPEHVKAAPAGWLAQDRNRVVLGKNVPP